MQAEGDYDLARRRWDGDLSQAVIRFPEGDARLIQPAALVLGHELQRVAPLCLRTDADARLCVEGEHRPQPQSWRVIYSAQDWPLQRLLRSLLGWREFDGRLQASGWAEQEPGQAWTGGTTVLLDEPVAQHPAQPVPQRAHPPRQQPLRPDRRSAADPRDARLRGRRVDLVRGRGPRPARAGQLLQSPLSGRIEGTSAAIKILPLLVPEIDRADGRLDGPWSLSGTLGAPPSTVNSACART